MFEVLDEVRVTNNSTMPFNIVFGAEKATIGVGETVVLQKEIAALYFLYGVPRPQTPEEFDMTAQIVAQRILNANPTLQLNGSTPAERVSKLETLFSKFYVTANDQKSEMEEEALEKLSVIDGISVEDLEKLIASNKKK